MAFDEEEDVDWFEVRGQCLLRSAPRFTAEPLGELLRLQRIQVSASAKVPGWLRLAAVEVWMTFCKKMDVYVPMEDEGFPCVVPIATPGGDWDQWAALLRWWPLGGLPPLLPATLGGAYLCHWRAVPDSVEVKAHWLRPGEELQFVGPRDAKAAHVCRWLKKDMALDDELDVVLVQDQLALDGCCRLLDHTDMKGVTRRFCALTFARPRLLAAEEVLLTEMAVEQQWQLRGSGDTVVDASARRWITSVYSQASQRLLAFFEELSQCVSSAATVVALVPAHVPIKEACIEALALTGEARSRCRVLRTWANQLQVPSWLAKAEPVLEAYSRRLHCFTLVGAYGPRLYMAQDVSALGHPVLGILTTGEGLEPEEPPPLALGLKVTLEGLSGDIIDTVAAARDWTVGQLKDTMKSMPRHEVRLLSSVEATDLPDDVRLSSLLPEDATHLTLRLLRVDPRWASAQAQVQRCAANWRDLEEDLKADRGLTLLAVTQEPSILSDCDAAFLSDAEVVLAAAKKDVSSLQLASHELWNDDQFLEAAIALDAKKAVQLALDCRLDELSGKHAEEAVRQDGLVLELLPAVIRARPEILRAALEQDVCALQFAPEAMKDDADLLQNLLRRDGRALRFASRRLRGDRSLVLLAIATCPRVVLCASEEVLQDREVLCAAFDGDPQLVQQLAHYASRI